MNITTFTTMVRSVGLLTYGQKKHLVQLLNHGLARTDVDLSIEEHSKAKDCCPHCLGNKIIRWGESGGLQRYRCKACERTFNGLTKSPLAKLRNREKFSTYIQCLRYGLTLRAAAKHCSISLKTSFRWRHRFLAGPQSHKSPELSGIIEIDETFFRESFKGNRQITHRKPRKRGHTSRDTPIVPVLIAIDRYGDEANFVLERPTKREIYECLHGRLEPQSVMCTDGNPIYKYLARTEHVVHKRIIASDGQRSIQKAFHIQNLNNYISRLKRWLVKFNGVGTGYMENYLAWWRLIDFHQDVKRDVWIGEALSDERIM